MSRGKKILIIIIWVIIIGIVLTPIIYIQGNKIIHKNKVMTYLIEEKGYERGEIESIESVWHLGLTPFYTEVTFKNEPYVKYIYFAHNETLQFEYYLTEEGKQKVITEKDLKNYEN